MRKYSEYDSLTAQVLGAAIEVHKVLGPGLLESTYQKCLLFELKQQKLLVKSEVSLPINYKGINFDYGYRIDILVENKIVLELKTVEAFTSVHSAQVLTYMKLGNHPVGYLLNFHVTMLKKGIKRFIL